jgi:hypothetical protein
VCRASVRLQGGAEVALAMWDLMDECGRGYPTKERRVLKALLKAAEKRSDGRSAEGVRKVGQADRGRGRRNSPRRANA